MCVHVQHSPPCLSPGSVAEAGIDHKDILVELPVTLRNSRLVNALLCELDVRDTKPDRSDFLGLSARCVCVCVCVRVWCVHACMIVLLAM